MKYLVPLLLLLATNTFAALSTVPARDVTLKDTGDNNHIVLSSNNVQCLTDWLDNNWPTSNVSIKNFVEMYANGYVYIVNAAIADTSNRMAYVTNTLTASTIAATNLADIAATSQGVTTVLTGQLAAAELILTNDLTSATNLVAVQMTLITGQVASAQEQFALISNQVVAATGALAEVGSSVITLTNALAGVSNQTAGIVARIANWVGTNVVTIVPQFTGYYYANFAGSNASFFDAASGIDLASRFIASNAVSDTGAFGFMAPGSNLCGVFGKFDSIIPQGITNCTEIRFPCLMSQSTGMAPVVKVMNGTSSFVWTNLAGLGVYRMYTQAVPVEVTAWLQQNTKLQWRIYSTNSSLTNGVPAYTLFQSPILYQATP